MTKDEEEVIFHNILLLEVKKMIEADQQAVVGHPLESSMQEMYLILNDALSAQLRKNKALLQAMNLRYEAKGKDADHFFSYVIYMRGYEDQMVFPEPHLKNLIHRTYKKLFDQVILRPLRHH